MFREGVCIQDSKQGVWGPGDGARVVAQVIKEVGMGMGKARTDQGRVSFKISALETLALT